MSIAKTELEKNIPWTKPKVIEIHKRFDLDFSQVTSEKDTELLLQRYFSFTGIIEEALRELAGTSEEPSSVMETAFELVSFRAYMYTCFFFNHFREAAVNLWWEEKGFRSWSGKGALSHPVIAELKNNFDKSLEMCRDVAEFHSLKDEYVGPDGAVAKALADLEKKTVEEQIEIGANLFNFKSYVDYSLYAVEFAMKSSHWVDHEVRGLVYQFERDLFTAERDEDVEKIIDMYWTKTQDLKKSHKNNAKKNEQITLFEQSLTHFKASKP